MKLIFCEKCADIKKLHREWVVCRCKKSHGRVVDGLNAEIGGAGVPLGIDNTTFNEAIRGRKNEGRGVRFEAFVISFNCKTVKEEREGENY
jgi:hypothetical protein